MSHRYHTPGPWVIKNELDVFSADGADSGDGYKADPDDFWTIANCGNSTSLVDGQCVELGHEVMKANARLIAAAPDLLKALEMMVFASVVHGYEADSAVAVARTAVRKALGQEGGE